MPAFFCFSEFGERLHISGKMDWCQFESSKWGWTQACNNPFWKYGGGGEVPLQEHWAASLRLTRLWRLWPCEQRWTPREDLLFRPKVKMSSLCCCCSITKLCLTLCNLVDCSTPTSSILHYLPEFVKFMSIELVMVSNHLFLYHPLLLLLLLSRFSHDRLCVTP